LFFNISICDVYLFDSIGRVISEIIEDSIPSCLSVLINIDKIELEPTSEEALRVMRLIDIIRRYRRGCIAIVAGVVGKISFAYLMAFHLDRPGASVQAFTEESEAQKWLLEKHAPKSKCES
jgi:hypothetical protein